MNKLIIIILTSLLFISCEKQESFQDYYSNADYEKIIYESEKRLSKSFNQDDLYYTVMAYYNLNRGEDALELAILYTYSFEEYNAFHKNILNLIILNDNGIEAYKAAEKLVKNYKQLSFSDITRYYKTVSLYDFDKAQEFYLKQSQSFSSREKLNILLNGKPPIIYYVSVLETLFEETGGNEEYQGLLALVLENVSKYVNINEYPLIINLAENTINDNPKGYLYLGDIIYKNGNRGNAIKYWNLASAVYPIEVRSRLVSL